LDNTPPEIAFFSPYPETVVNGVITLVGQAEDAHFGYYKLEYGAGEEPTEWTLISEYNNQVAEGPLGEWDTTELSDGKYTIRLTTLDCVTNQAQTALLLVVGKPEFLTQIGGFNKPEGVALSGYTMQDTGYKIYVADRNNDRVAIYDKEHNLIKEIKDFNKPVDVTVDEEENIYVVDRNNDRVVRYDKDYNLTLEITDSKWNALNKPEGALVSDNNGTTLYVADRNNHEVKIYQLTDSTYQLVDTITGFNSPEGIAYKIFADGEEKLYVSDTNNDKVKIFKKINNEWQLATIIGEAGSEQSQFNKPGGIHVLNNGYFYIVDQNNNRVQKFDKYGHFLMQFGEIGNQNGQFNKPKDVVLDSDGEIYVADRNNNRIQIFTYSGTGGKLRLALFDKEKPETPLTINEFYNYPNPFSPNNDGDRDKTTIYFELSTQADVSIYIYNVVGKLVKIFDTVYNTSKEGETAGDPDTTWDGRNDSGRVCANGVYIIYLKAKTPEGQIVEDVHKCAILK